MNSKTPMLDKSFLDGQRLKLTGLREQLLRASRGEQAEEAAIRSQSLGQANESEDDAQKLALLEVDGTVVERALQRLALVERALQKIENGTYGFSEASGEPIARERLEATPEARYTLSELKAREGTDTHAAASRKP
jgi:DnaK suppressor protein